MPLSWYINRVRTMTAPEIAFRFGQFLQKKREKRTQVSLQPAATLQALPKKLLPHNSAGIHNDTTTISIFGLDFDYSQPIDWHKDISSRRRFPMTFAKDINIRTEQYGSAKHVWEVNRLQFLNLIALRYKATQDEQHLRQFQQIVSSWIEANPYLLGVNWYSNIEVNIRLIVWFFCWEILDVNALMDQDAAFKSFVEKQWIPAIYLHCKYSHENPSYFSSANNHLISEYAGLFIAASYWKFEESALWLKEAKTGLEHEIQVQHSISGVNKEEASEYIQFITDFFLFAYVVGDATHHTFSEAYREKLKAILDYIFQLMDVQGNIPYYGDEDDGKVCIFSPDPHVDNFCSLLTSGVVLFKEAAWKTKAHGFDTKNQVLFGDAGKEQYDAVKATENSFGSRFYVDQGHFIFRKQQGRQEIYLHLDAAPLGFLSIAAHGHADALSFVLHVDGQPMIVDAGTYTYHTEPDWRSYFIGTLAHNTIRIDQKDQAQSAGPTMWLNHYEVKVVEQTIDEDIEQVMALHTGYQKMGVIHQRHVVFDRQQDTFIITDRLHINKPRSRQLDMPLHLHPEVKISQKADCVYEIIRPGARTVEVTVDPQLAYTIVHGQQEPLLGWYSPSFQVKEPTTVLYGQYVMENSSTLDSATLVTKIKVLASS